MLFLRPIARSVSTSQPVKKAVHNVQVQQGFHWKEKIITAEKGLAVVAVGTLAVMLPAPTTLDGVCDVDCFWHEARDDGTDTSAGAKTHAPDPVLICGETQS